MNSPAFRLAAAMLGDVLPLGRPVAPERVRRHLHAIAVGEEAALGEEPAGWAWSGCQRDLDEMPAPGGPAHSGVDGGYVRDRAGSWFEVIAGKSVPGFRRDAPGDEPPRPGKCFAYVQAYDDSLAIPARTRPFWIDKPSDTAAISSAIGLRNKTLPSASRRTTPYGRWATIASAARREARRVSDTAGAPTSWLVRNETKSRLSWRVQLTMLPNRIHSGKH